MNSLLLITIQGCQPVPVSICKIAKLSPSDEWEPFWTLWSERKVKFYIMAPHITKSLWQFAWPKPNDTCIYKKLLQNGNIASRCGVSKSRQSADSSSYSVLLDGHGPGGEGATEVGAGKRVNLISNRKTNYVWKQRRYRCLSKRKRNKEREWSACEREKKSEKATTSDLKQFQCNYG